MNNVREEYLATLLAYMSGDTRYWSSRRGLRAAEPLTEMMKEVQEIESIYHLSYIRSIILHSSVYPILIKAPYKAILVRQNALKSFLVLERNGINLFSQVESESSWQISVVELYNRILTTQKDLIMTLLGKYLPLHFDYMKFLGLKTITTRDLTAEKQRISEIWKMCQTSRFFGSGTLIVGKELYNETTLTSLFFGLSIAEEQPDPEFTYIATLKQDVEDYLTAIKPKEEVPQVEEAVKVENDEGVQQEQPVPNVTPKKEKQQVRSTESTLVQPDTKFVQYAKDDSTTTVTEPQKDKKQGTDPFNPVPTSFNEHVEDTPEADFSTIVYVDCDNNAHNILKVITYLNTIAKDKKIVAKLFIDTSAKELWTSLVDSEKVKYEKVQCQRFRREKSMADVLITEALVKDKVLADKPLEQHIVTSDSDFGCLAMMGYDITYVYSEDSVGASFKEFLASGNNKFFDLSTITKDGYDIATTLKEYIAQETLEIMRQHAPVSWQVGIIAYHIEKNVSTLSSQLGSNNVQLLEIIQETLTRVKVDYDVKEGLTLKLA